MKIFSRLVVKYKKFIIITFILLAVAGGMLINSININYDMVDYLPENAKSTTAISVMQDEFGSDTPNMRVMVSEVSVLEALEYKNNLSQIDGVLSVTWLDNVVGKGALIATPIEFLDRAIVENFYKNRNALFSVAIESGQEDASLEQILELIGEDNAAAGDAVNAATMQNMAVSEVIGAMKFLVPIILIILILSTTSWLEPLLFLITIGVAVLINMGTMVLSKDISFITQTVSPILQLAVSLDYAIFLLHSFDDFRQTHEPIKAMKLAMRKAVSSISASAATTVIGFLALLFMNFGIGSDLGIHLAKGVALSFVSVTVFLPALTLSAYKLLDKTRHRKLFPRLDFISKCSMKLKTPFLILAILVALPCFLAQSKTDYMYGMGSMTDSTRAAYDAEKIEAQFGTENLIVLLVKKDDSGKEAELCSALSAMPNIDSVVSYTTAVGVGIPEKYVPPEAAQQFYSENYARIILYTSLEEESEQTFSAIENISNLTEKYYGENYYLAGQSATLYDMKNIIEADTKTVNLVAIIGIFLVIMLTFRSLLVPFILVFTIEAAIWINLSFPYFTDSALSFIGYLVISTVQLGATVDYAILLSNHYLEERKLLPKKQAMLKSITDTLPALLTSAGILATAGFTLAATSTNFIILELGLLLGRGTVLSLIMVVFVLPGMLTLFDKAIGKTTLKSNFYRKDCK
ncbi:MAG TPA: MMPL family transporter [Oscillospiraceae bacterium]|nr:MMPL family transporter [Oscillospiraceae bacterium]